MTNKQNYLGRVGYAVYKDGIDNATKKKIEKELKMTPVVSKNMPIQPVSFPVYRESSSRYYLPKFYALNTFGTQIDMKLSEPVVLSDTTIFNGTLREYQQHIVAKYINHVRTQYAGIGVGGGCLEIDTGLGKTVMAIDIIAKMKLKTIILVHKEFLLNQWVERIQEFLPMVSIGRLQGRILDVDKDIVIAMIQSLSMKDYSKDVFDGFGLMIIDEVHHMGAEVFSNALCKVVTPYTLGLSATMNRKDGLSKIFKMFLGDTIHTEKRDTSQQPVAVKVLRYTVDDDDYNTVPHDYNGNIAYGVLLAKVCKYSRRTDYIVQYLKYMVETGPETQQIMILGQTKAILKYLFDAIKHQNIAGGDVGYYVGGMKESELKKSELNKIIIATYSMASEGLDIKTLNALILATPRSDVVQSVGRILRIKHTHQPVVVDVVDSHDVFKRQYLKRKAFYKQQKYIITETSNSKRINASTVWDVAYDPSGCLVQTVEDDTVDADMCCIRI